MYSFGNSREPTLILSDFMINCKFYCLFKELSTNKNLPLLLHNQQKQALALNSY